MDSQTQYQYTTLPRPGSICLLRLQPSPSPSSTLHCSLTTASIDALPPYKALSYVWGDPTLSSTIFISNSPLQIAANCFEALQHLAPKSSDEEERLVWVDFICIKQQDVSELNTQVSMMAEIYGKAERVVVWSGKESENDAVIEKLHYLRRHYTGEVLDNETRAKCKSC
jgi:Heterokaryon incompatibility protein (HET)